jgi:flagellar assembly protein FliH
MEELAPSMARAPHFSDMKPFLFERSFDDPNAPSHAENAAAKAAANEVEAEEQTPEAPPEISYGEAEFEAAKQASYMDGHADGFREGQAEAMETINHKLNELLEQLSPMIAALGEAQARSNERAQANMARIVKATLSKLMPVYVRHHGHEEVLAVVSDCLAELQDPGRLTVRLSEESADLLGERLSKAARNAGFEGTLRLLTDPEMDRSDVRVDWGAGGAERRYDTIKEEIDAAIDGAVARAEAAFELAETDAGTEHGSPASESGLEDAPEQSLESRTETNAVPQEAADRPEPDAIAETSSDPTRE